MGDGGGGGELKWRPGRLRCFDGDRAGAALDKDTPPLAVTS